MENAMLVKMRQPVGGLSYDTHGILQRQCLNINQIRYIQPFDVFKNYVVSAQ